MAEMLEAQLIIFNDSLTPTQQRNLQKALDVPVWDRTGLILEIFSRRARTREARLQVESARLQYMLPRLVGMRRRYPDREEAPAPAVDSARAEGSPTAAPARRNWSWIAGNRKSGSASCGVNWISWRRIAAPREKSARGANCPPWRWSAIPTQESPRCSTPCLSAATARRKSR